MVICPHCNANMCDNLFKYSVIKEGVVIHSVWDGKILQTLLSLTSSRVGEGFSKPTPLPPEILNCFDSQCKFTLKKTYPPPPGQTQLFLRLPPPGNILSAFSYFFRCRSILSFFLVQIIAEGLFIYLWYIEILSTQIWKSQRQKY